MQYSDKDQAINDKFYGYFLRHNQDDGWDDKDKYGNFKLLADIINLTHKPLMSTFILDVGCGTGDLYGYLQKLAPQDNEFSLKNYLGIDLYKMSVEYAQMKYPEGNFIQGDFLEYNFNQTFDYIFCSGALAAVLDTDNYAMMASFIKKMWSLATLGVAFNFLTREYEKDKDNELFLYDLDNVLKLCKKNAPSSKIEYIQNRAGDEEDFLQTHIYLAK